MADSIFSASAFLDWHAFARFFAVALLAGLLLFVLLQFAFSRSHDNRHPWLGGGSLRVALVIGLTLVGVIPTAALGILLSERSAHLRHERMERRIEETASSVSYGIESFVDKHVSGISGVASTISANGRFDTDALTESMLRYHAIYDDFLTMLSTNASGDIVAATSQLGGVLAPVRKLAGFNVADREYFVKPMTNGFPFISQAFEGRGLGRDPIVAISAALKDAAGNRVGVVEGSLNLKSFGQIDRKRPHIDGAAMIIVDESSRVIYSSSETGLSFLEDISADPMIEHASRVRQSNSFSYSDEADGSESGYLAAYASTAVNWKVFIRVPTRPIAQQMLGDYGVGVLLLLATSVLSLLLASALVRRVSQTIADMNDAVAKFSLDGTGQEVVTPTNTPREFRPFFSLMRERSRNLRKAYKRLANSIAAGEKLRKDLTHVIARKEVEIAERTAELEDANRRLASQSKRDALTGIANRREFDAFEKRVWRAGARDGVPVAVVLMDIDYFKIYNDTLGHQAGDDCLRKVAKVLEGCATRPLDLVARYGGEEFVAVLGGASVADALVVAERMRLAVLGLEIEHPGSQNEFVTISIGAASMLPSADNDAQSLIRAADEALYYAKAAGRNCVVFRNDGEYVTYESEQHDIESTNVIAILAGSRPTRRRGD